MRHTGFTCVSKPRQRPNQGKNSVSPKLSPGLSGHPLQPKLIKVAEAFVDLQQARHDADYDMSQRFLRRDVLHLIDQQ